MNRLLLALALAALLVSPAARAYRFESANGGSTSVASQGNHWPAASMPIPWLLQSDAPTGTSRKPAFGPNTTWTQVHQAAISGFATWAAAAPAIKMQAPTNMPHSAGTSQDDGQNRIYWVNPGEGWQFGQATLGVTTPWATQAGQLVDADIQFNENDWEWEQVANGVQGCDTCVDAQSITTHEEGHFLGMAHSCETDAIQNNTCPQAQLDAVMAAYYDGYAKQQLAPDDIAGIKALYPSGGQHSFPQGSICSSNADCVSGLSCLGPAGGATICTKACPATCDAGYSCQAVSSGQACLPTAPPGAGDLCKACGSGADCSNGLCVATDTFAYCTTACSQTQGCPAGYACATEQGTNQSFCYPTANQCTGNCDNAHPCPSGQACESGTCKLQPAAEGQPCGTSTCQSGLVCVGTSQADATCHRSCTAGGANTCPSGQECDALSGGTTGEGACFPQTATAQEGQSCSSAQCAQGLLCVGTSQTDATCRRSCSTSSECAQGQTCAQLSGGGGACVPGSSGGNTGGTVAACGTCASSADCESGLFCVQTSAGRVCEAGCSSQAACPGSQTCQAMGGVPGFTGVCSCSSPKVAEGGSCADDSACQSGLICVVDHTASPAACRTPCTSDAQCGTGKACTAFGAARVCETATSTGDGSGGGSGGGGGGGTTNPQPCGCTSSGPMGLLSALLGFAGLVRRRRVR